MSVELTVERQNVPRLSSRLSLDSLIIYVLKPHVPLYGDARLRGP